MNCYKSLFLSVLLFAGHSVAYAENKDINISIYNNNLALVKDTRKIYLKGGINEVAFEGVATQIKPESVMILGENIKVLEQNYDYNLITEQNILQKSVGNMVKTVVQNPTTGENIFNKAKILSAEGSVPVLEFDYGIETDFNGRLVFEKLPANLREKPTLMAKINSTDATTQNLDLVYLTNGISWKTNYVARIKNESLLDLTAWVAVNNMSGVDYDNAKIDLIAGEVNQINESSVVLNRAVKPMALGVAMAVDSAIDESVVPQTLSSYQLYSLPNRADIKDKQTKQVSLFEKTNVKYHKQGRLTSRLYFNNGSNSSFEKSHPDIYYIINNTKDANLDVPLPTGMIRFYENDDQGNMQFIGENSIKNTAKGEKMELKLGQMFNVFVNGKIVDAKEVSKTKGKPVTSNCYYNDIVKDYVAEAEFVNGSDEVSEVLFVQNIGQDSQIVKESSKGSLKNVSQYEWKFELKPNSTTKLDYTVRVNSKEKDCY